MTKWRIRNATGIAIRAKVKIVRNCDPTDPFWSSFCLRPSDATQRTISTPNGSSTNMMLAPYSKISFGVWAVPPPAPPPGR